MYCYRLDAARTPKVHGKIVVLAMSGPIDKTPGARSLFPVGRGREGGQFRGEKGATSVVAG
jgi:hypothetical protein